MAARLMTIDAVMATLTTTVPRITELSTGLTPARLNAAPEADAWSINDVLAHLRACHDVLGGNVLRILAEDRPAWKGMNPRTWQKKTDYHEWEFVPAFEAFAGQRAALLAVLEPLPREVWQRYAVVKVPPAKTYEYTALYYADWMAGHERAHLKHIRRLVDWVNRRD
jgi:hypothetical protein